MTERTKLAETIMPATILLPATSERNSSFYLWNSVLFFPEALPTILVWSDDWVQRLTAVDNPPTHGGKRLQCVDDLRI